MLTSLGVGIHTREPLAPTGPARKRRAVLLFDRNAVTVVRATVPLVNEDAGGASTAEVVGKFGYERPTAYRWLTDLRDERHVIS